MDEAAPLRKRILFVDDEASIRMTLPPILEKAGFDVHIAESVPDAIFEINSYQFDALITDLNIGEEGDGFLVASGMRHIQPECAIFILTGYPAFETALQAIHSQVDDYLVKPVEVESLVGTLKDRIENRVPKAGSGPRRIFTAFRESQEKLAADIAGAIGSASKDSGRMSAGELAGRIRELLTAVIAQTEAERDHMPAAALREAAEYGEWRQKNGAGASVIVADFRSIEQALLDSVQAGQLLLDPAPLVSDLKRMCMALSSLMEQAVQPCVAAPIKGAHG
jgi:ActR/RegA family two-component response regulator